MNKSLLLLLSVVVLFSQTGLYAQDTLSFIFDPNSQSLSLRQKGSTLLYFDTEQNPFANTLWKHGGRDKPLDGSYMKIGDLPEIISNFTGFDSAMCIKLKIGSPNPSTFEIEPYKKVTIQVEIIPVEKTFVDTVCQTDARENQSFDYVLLMAFASLGIFLLIVVIVIVRKKKKSSSQPTFEKRSSELGLEVVEVVTSYSQNGLDHIRQQTTSYFEIDLQDVYADTCIHKIYLHHSAIKKMYDFFKSSLESSNLTEETGCYFIGCWEFDDESSKIYNISVEDIVEPGDDIVPGEFSFNFGKKIGVKLTSLISKLSQETNRDFVQTVWMHSHPGLGLFLSSHDLLVQKQLAYADHPGRLAAFVIDTNTPDWQFAIFTAKRDGTMNNKENEPYMFSLDKLYEWSRNAHAVELGNPPMLPSAKTVPSLNENYHAVQVNHQGNTRTLNMYLSGKAINVIDDVLYKSVGKQIVGGWFVGRKDASGNYIIDDCLENPPDSYLGILVVDGKSTFEDIIRIHVKGTNAACVLVCRSEDVLWIMEQSESGYGSESDIAVCSMKPMKEWLRRRRVYK